jgi:hypothetical protein
VSFDFNEAQAWQPKKRLCYAFYEFELRPLRECLKCIDYPRCKSVTFARREHDGVKNGF